MYSLRLNAHFDIILYTGEAGQRLTCSDIANGWGGDIKGGVGDIFCPYLYV